MSPLLRPDSTPIIRRPAGIDPDRPHKGFTSPDGDIPLTKEQEGLLGA